jgi:hypothetical protein
LRRLSANASNANQWFWADEVGSIHFFRGQLQHGLKKRNAWIANSKLRGVNSHAQATRTRGDIVAS